MGLETTAEGLARVVADSMPDGMLVVDPAGVITLANHEIERQFGYPRDHLIGQSIDILLPEFRVAHAEHRASSMTVPDAQQMAAGRELTGRRRNGSEFPVEVGLRALAAEPGSPVVASVVDLTARRRAEWTSPLVSERQLEFEGLVAELSTSFINLPADRVDDAMRDALAADRRGARHRPLHVLQDSSGRYGRRSCVLAQSRRPAAAGALPI